MADGPTTTGQNTARAFTYQSVNSEGEVFEGTIFLPRNGFLECLEDSFESNIDAGVKFNTANILTPEVIDYCIGRIEARHTTRSEKSVAYLKLAKLILMDDRHFETNVPKAVDFLLQHADKIGNGITRLATNEDFYRQSNVAGYVMENMARVCQQVKNLDKRKNIIDKLIASYSSALADFFDVPENVDRRAYSDTRDYSSRLFMHVLTDCYISVPEFFKNARIEFLKGLAQEAFEYVTQPEQYSHHKALGIRKNFSGIVGALPNELGTVMSDPIHLAGDNDNNFLIMARNDKGALTFIFSARVTQTESIGICANSISDLKANVGAVRTCGKSLVRPLEGILHNMARWA